MSAKGTSEGWGAQEGVLTHSCKGVGWSGSSPEPTFKLEMPVEANLIHFEINFACETRHIIQALHVGVFKRAPKPTTKVST